MNPAATAAALLADNPAATLSELTEFTAGMDTRSEDLFWAKVREERPTLCPEWTD